MAEVLRSTDSAGLCPHSPLFACFFTTTTSSDFLEPFIDGLRPQASPLGPRALLVADSRISRFPCIRLPCVLGVFDHGEPTWSFALYGSSGVAFRLLRLRRHPQIRFLSRLNTRPALSPVNASPTPLRLPAHDSGPRRLAKSFHVRHLPPLPHAGLPALS